MCTYTADAKYKYPKLNRNIFGRCYVQRQNLPLPLKKWVICAPPPLLQILFLLSVVFFKIFIFRGEDSIILYGLGVQASFVFSLPMYECLLPSFIIKIIKKTIYPATAVADPLLLKTASKQLYYMTTELVGCFSMSAKPFSSFTTVPVI